MADLAQYQAWLTEAESALHTVMTGSGVAEVWREGRRVVYTKRNASDLQAYVTWLRGEIARLTEQENGTVSGRRSIGVVFGG